MHLLWADLIKIANIGFKADSGQLSDSKQHIHMAKLQRIEITFIAVIHIIVNGG